MHYHTEDAQPPKLSLDSLQQLVSVIAKIKAAHLSTQQEGALCQSESSPPAYSSDSPSAPVGAPAVSDPPATGLDFQSNAGQSIGCSKAAGGQP